MSNKIYKKDKLPIQRSNQQNRALHKGCQEVADLLIESGVSLQVLLQHLDVRPSMESIKAIYRDIARAKFEVSSTADLDTTQVNKVWEDLSKAVSQTTGVYIPFPSYENSEEYLKSYETFN